MQPEFSSEFEKPTKRPRVEKRPGDASVASSTRKKEDVSDKQSIARSRKMSDHASLTAVKRQNSSSKNMGAQGRLPPLQPQQP